MNPLVDLADYGGSCESAPWWTAPVIVGGSGGSGTRGTALLLQTLGVAMACLSPDFMDTAAACKLKCNAAADCGVLSAFRTGKAVGGHGALSWLRRNGSYANASCNAIDHAALHDALTRTDAKAANKTAVNGFANSTATARCGVNKQAAIRALQQAVAPQHQRPLRWGMKNPHSTYYVNVLRRLFPCMVYVNTLRDLDVMVRTMKHFDSRVHEAVTFGMLEESHSEHVKSSVALSQRFYGHYLRRVNGGLNSWLARCMPGRFVHVSLQRLVIRAAPVNMGEQSGVDANRARTMCFEAVVTPLIKALKIKDEVAAANATRHFLRKSAATVRESLGEASKHKLTLPSSHPALAWPPELDVVQCHGPLNPTLNSHYPAQNGKFHAK